MSNDWRKNLLHTNSASNSIKVLSQAKKESAFVEIKGGAEKVGVGTVDKENVKAETENGKIKKYTTTEVYQRNYISNPLHDFQSYNAIFTMAALTLEEVNFPDLLYSREPQFPVAQSAGKTGPEVTVYKQAGLNLEYLVDDVEIQSIVSPSKKNKHTQFTQMTFTVREPYSIGLFFQTLNVQAVRAANDGDANYLKAPYCLIIDFVGQDANGKTFKNAKLRKVIPFNFTKAALRASAAGSIYECNAVPVSEYGLMTVNNTTKHDITMSGKTVYEMLQVGDNSLMGQLNFKGDKKDKAKKKDDKTTKPPADDYVIYFPYKTEKSVSQEQRKVILQDRAIKNEVVYDEPEQQRYSGAFTTAKRDTGVETLLGNNIVVTNEFDGVGGQGIRVFQSVDGEDAEAGASFLGNEIGEAKMHISEGNMAIIGKTFPEFKENYDKVKKTFTRDKITLNLKEMTLSFAKGSYITDIIETVILLSEYSLKLTKSPEELPNVPLGHKPWFRIVTKCFELKDSFVQKITKQNPKLCVYSVIPFPVPDELFIGPDQYPAGVTEIRNNIVKGFNYIYTGLNTDILDFQLDYNFAFYDSVSEKTNKTANSSAANEDFKAENSATVIRSKRFEVRGQDPALKNSSGALSVRPQDQIDAADEGTENESPELKIAREMNKRIINSNVDLLHLDMQIIGDPYFLPSSGMMNSDEVIRTYVDPRSFYTADGQITATGQAFGNGRGELNHINRLCYVEVSFQTPIDLQPDGNNFIFPNNGSYRNGYGESVKLGEFSGLYRVYKIVNSFRQGKFEQTLTLIRSASMASDAKEGSKENKNVVKEKEERNRKSEQFGLGAYDGS